MFCLSRQVSSISLQRTFYAIFHITFISMTTLVNEFLKYSIDYSPKWPTYASTLILQKNLKIADSIIPKMTTKTDMSCYTFLTDFHTHKKTNAPKINLVYGQYVFRVRRSLYYCGSAAIFQRIQLAQPTRAPTSVIEPSNARGLNLAWGLVMVEVNSIAIFVISL